MSPNRVVVEGIVRSDGSLEISEKVDLRPGTVQVIVTEIPERTIEETDPFWQRMQAIWDARRAAGLVPRSEEEVEHDRRQSREEWNQRMQSFERE